MEKTKSFAITKRQVWEAYKKVKRNKGSAGVDKVDIATFEANLENNLYKLWNRLSSGSYIPPPVLRVEIPKSDGGRRALGIPTVADRVAQMVVKGYLEPLLEPYFHQDSYGYRPNKSAHQALVITKQRCQQYPYVLDLDIKGFFDNIDHDLMMKAVETHTQEKWVLLYIKRWLQAPVQSKEELISRTKGTPQGGVISPLLANLFLHYAFDLWMKRNYPSIPFERYADDVVCHCKSEYEAKELKVSLQERMEACKLQLHPQKTKIAYCKDERRSADYSQVKFDFLGYSFQPEVIKNRRYSRGVLRFLPRPSQQSKNKIAATINSWKSLRHSGANLITLAEMFGPVLRGWINYYSLFEHYNMRIFLIRQFDRRIIKWARKKYKVQSYTKMYKWLERIKKSSPELFPHWPIYSKTIKQ